MASRFQAVPLVTAPSYPNAVVWSEENLIAVAAGHLVSIINPALPSGPRGSITIQSTEPYAFGKIRKEDLLCPTMLPIALSRDHRPFVRSISWSPPGMASNSGCLIAVCTTEGRVIIYRPPYCDFSAEWIEVIDVSDELYRYLLGTEFRNFTSDEMPGRHNTYSATLKSCLENERKRKLAESTTSGKNYCKRDSFSSKCDGINFSISGKTEGKNVSKNFRSNLCTIEKPDMPLMPLIAADQYAYRSALLWSLVVAWSPAIFSFHGNHSTLATNVQSRFSVLAVGGKSGIISFWKIGAPQWYSVEHSKNPSIALAQLLQAHKTWVTTLSFAVTGFGSCSKTILASGSSDGSVKIWVWIQDDSSMNGGCFAILNEVLSVSNAPVSVVSLVVLRHTTCSIVLAAGKGSGILELWTSDEKDCTFSKIFSHKSHDYVITGLAWSSSYFYSCGQDNYIRGWNLQNETVVEVPLPTNTPDIRSATELPDIFLSCQGLAISPGNLTLVAIRNLDTEQLNPMYQARAQRSILEFFWLGGNEVAELSRRSAFYHKAEFLPLPGKELSYWESNVLSCLKDFENSSKPLVLWDVIHALSSFKQSMPAFVDALLSAWFSESLGDRRLELSLDDLLVAVSQSFRTLPSRKLQMINVVCRRVGLSELGFEETNGEVDLGEMVFTKGERVARWLNVLAGSEKELRERLAGVGIGVGVSDVSVRMENAERASGVAQLHEWVASCADQAAVNNRRIEGEREEKCVYCLSAVPFESPTNEFCRGSESLNGVVPSHKLSRRASSMRVCDASPTWHCKCCNRWVQSLAPSSLLATRCSEPRADGPPKPVCPFCGISLQRWQPEFLPSVSPV